MPACLIMTTTAEKADAKTLATGLVERHLAACVQILPITSIYTWQGNLNQGSEFLLMIKTRDELYAAIENDIRARHPYALPEIIKMPITAGLPDYLAWITANTASSQD